MPSPTIKNIPEDLYEKLKISANANRRSLNSECIYSLEKLFKPRKITAGERIRRAGKIRPDFQEDLISPEQILETIRNGRPRSLLIPTSSSTDFQIINLGRQSEEGV